jgi:hypothetical protein
MLDETAKLRKSVEEAHFRIDEHERRIQQLSQASNASVIDAIRQLIAALAPRGPHS